MTAPVASLVGARIFIADENRFALPEPPLWWQQRLFDYDAALRLMPSRKDRLYRLGRLASREGRLGLQTMIVHTHPDTVMMIRHGCLPVSSIFPWAIYSDTVIRDLMARDTWAHGGADALDRKVNAMEQARAAADDRQTQGDLDAVSGDAFRSMQYRNGSRIAVGRPRAAARVDSHDHKSVISPSLVSSGMAPSSRRPASPAVILTDR